MDFGYMAVTADCPADGCAGTEVVRVWGQNGDSLYRTVYCTTCEVSWTIKVVVTVSGAVTNYVID